MSAWAVALILGFVLFNGLALALCRIAKITDEDEDDY